MAQYLNSNKEYHWGDWYFKDHVMDPAFDYKAHKKELSPYYEERGFKVSMMYDDFFSRLNGIHSDRYISMDVYYFFVVPALNRYDFINAYLDKNIYSDLFPFVKQPLTVVKNMQGLFYHNGEVVTRQQAVDLVAGFGGEMMIKPTIETCNGERVQRVADITPEGIQSLFSQYDINFIVQEKAKQHSDLERVNPTSLNSMRLYTYRSLDGVCHFIDRCATLRYGGKGAHIDNMSQGGGSCLIAPDGRVDDRVFRFKSLNVSSLKAETGVENLVVPNFPKIVDTLLKMHKRLPYFDFVGWDVAVDPDGEPIFIEFNLVPGIEGSQIMAGPLLDLYLDEVVERARQGVSSRVQTNKKVFPRNSVFYLHMK